MPHVMNNNQKLHFGVLKIQYMYGVYLATKSGLKSFPPMDGYIDTFGWECSYSINMVLIKSLQLEICIINPIVFRKFSNWVNNSTS